MKKPIKPKFNKIKPNVADYQDRYVKEVICEYKLNSLYYNEDSYSEDSCNEDSYVDIEHISLQDIVNLCPKNVNFCDVKMEICSDVNILQFYYLKFIKEDKDLYKKHMLEYDLAFDEYIIKYKEYQKHLNEYGILRIKKEIENV